MKFIRNMAFMFRYSWKISKRSFLAAAIQITLGAVEPFIYLIFPALVIDELTGERDWNTVLLIIGLFIGSLVLLRGLSIAFNVFINMSINRSDVKTGLSYAYQCAKMDYEKLEDEKVRNLQQTVVKQVHPNNFIFLILSSFLTSLIQLFGYAYLIAMLHPVVLAVIFCLVVANYFLNRKLSKNEYRYQPTLSRYTRLFDYLFETMTNFDYAKEVRVNRAKEILSGKFDRTASDFNTDNKKFLKKQLWVNILLRVVSFVQMLFSYGYVAYIAIMGEISVGEFSLYIGAIYNLSGAFNNVVAQCIKMKFLSKYIDDYHEYENIALPQHEKTEINDMPQKNPALPMFEFEHVSFVYPNTERVVLNDVSIRIHTGEKLSIVVMNGAGKTTFVKLLCRFYYPTKGVIKYYGVDISTIKREEYLRALAVVFQDFKVFSFSFLENIVLNQPLDEEKLDRTIRDAGLQSRVDSLPNGLATNIYKDFDENGIEFSGGEGQKLVIARAYYKDARFVILDEPTAALDALAEDEIYQNFKEITAGKTSIFISHRLASTRFCDHIAVFQDGKIVEYGDHEALMQQNGLYAEMFDKQAQYYRVSDGGAQ